jgi:hypothetical protein
VLLLFGLLECMHCCAVVRCRWFVSTAVAATADGGVVSGASMRDGAVAFRKA